MVKSVDAKVVTLMILNDTLQSIHRRDHAGTTSAVL